MKPCAHIFLIRKLSNSIQYYLSSTIDVIFLIIPCDIKLHLTQTTLNDEGQERH